MIPEAKMVQEISAVKKWFVLNPIPPAHGNL